jgi:hypothetical protein
LVLDRREQHRQEALCVEDVARVEQPVVRCDLFDRVAGALVAQRGRQQSRDCCETVRAQLERVDQVAVRVLQLARDAAVARAFRELDRLGAEAVDVVLQIDRALSGCLPAPQEAEDGVALLLRLLDVGRDLADVVLVRVLLADRRTALDQEEEQDDDDDADADREQLPAPYDVALRPPRTAAASARRLCGAS